MTNDEQITIGNLAGPGTFALINTRGAEVLEVVLCPLTASTLQLFESVNPISGAWPLAANEKWSWPGKYVQGNLNLQISNGATVNFEVRWKAGVRAHG